MKCGQRVDIVSWNGGVVAVAVAQCGGRFLAVVHDPAWQVHDAALRNGELLYGWEALLDRLVWLIAHPVDKDQPGFAYTARSVGATYTQVLLQNAQFNPVRVSELAALLEAPEAEVRVRLRDYLVIPEPEQEAVSGK